MVSFLLKCYETNYIITINIFTFLESIKSTRGLRRMSEEEIKTKMGRWFKSAPNKIGKDSVDVESDLSSEDK